MQCPKVQAEIAERREEMRQETRYSVEAAMADLERAEALAHETSNATAAARCVELRMKLHGLMVEKHATVGALEIRLVSYADA